MPAYTTLRSTHYVEGQDPLMPLPRPSGPSGRDRSQLDWDAYERRSGAILAQKREFAAKAKVRAKIKPIADPEEGKAKRRKTAARRRQRGRLGTMLTQRETLS